MGWPQIAMIALMAAGGTIYLVKHGEDKGTFNFFTWLVAAALELWILIAGGFFN